MVRHALRHCCGDDAQLEGMREENTALAVMVAVHHLRLMLAHWRKPLYTDTLRTRLTRAAEVPLAQPSRNPCPYSSAIAPQPPPSSHCQIPKSAEDALHVDADVPVCNGSSSCLNRHPVYALSDPNDPARLSCLRLRACAVCLVCVCVLACAQAERVRELEELSRDLDPGPPPPPPSNLPAPNPSPSCLYVAMTVSHGLGPEL